ncbi:UvrD-helicase domain-containing protein [Enhygromyxa salina]|nr:UvrD-helicase domain-containing protein [Enhygromyxa salina]
MHDVRVAMSADFLRGYSRLAKQQQRSVRAWIDKFRADPRSDSIKYKKPKGMRDPKVRSVRITQQYRAIVIHPPKDDVYLLVWVDNHDEALEWARNKVFEVNRFTGTFQVYEPREVEGEASQLSAPPASDSLVGRVELNESAIPAGFLFAGHQTEDLLLFGVPEPLLPAVRALRTEINLDELAPYLPDEAADALYLLAAGFTVDETLDELDRRTEPGQVDVAVEPVDVDDFAESLTRDQSKRAFKLLEDDAELAAMLAAPLEQWRVFLHPSQAKLVSMHSNGSARVLGGAGTGKTVVAMHRARYLAKQIFTEPGQRILLTTFTSNLAADIRENLRRMCGTEFERIDVKHLQEVARDVLAARGVKLERSATNKQSATAWQRALGAHSLEFGDVFYKEEWSRVVQAQNVTSEAEYLRARRAGRGKRLSRGQRREVWKVLAEYRQQLDLAGLSEHADVIREARFALADPSASSGFVSVIADEVQDFRTADLELLRALVAPGPNDIFVVGDPHQRIYGHKASLGRCGISIRGRRSRKLRINYRTTQNIRNWAVATLRDLDVDDLDEGTDSLAGERSLRLGDAPELRLFDGIEDEVEYIAGLIQAWIADGVEPSEICVAARTKYLINDSYIPALAARGVETTLIQTETTDKLPNLVRVANMHRVKGLEFPRVILAGIHEGNMPYEDSAYATRDPKAKALYDEGERKLLYVAATRARDVLVVTGCGEASALTR